MRNVVAVSPKLVFTEDGQYLSELPEDYYATRTYTDKMINFIEEDRGDGKPFFAYVAHQAPHDPYHLPEEWRTRHVGEYDKGWDLFRRQRLKKQIEMGITVPGTQLSERMWFVPDPTQLAPAARAVLGMKMELYAGMVENMDMHVGRLIDYLKSIGEYENTIFIVFGDNGAEGTDLFEMIAGTEGTLNALNAAINWSQTHPKAWGNPESFVGYGPMWAQVSMTPFSQYKGWLAEGGIRNALVVSGPVVNRPGGSVHHATMHVADIMPTLLDVANTEYPEVHEGKRLPQLMGKSWLTMLNGDTENVRTDEDYLGWELFGNRAIRQGNWKLRWQWRPFGTGDWELFNLETDASERTNLAKGNQRKLNEMLSLWADYVEKNNVILPSRSVYENLEDQLPQRFPDDPGYPPLIYKRQFVPPPELVKE
jgi:arylsulfatase